jgi:uncharacterized protein (UPF0261 family)
MSKLVAILATLDTKGPEALFLKELIISAGLDALIIDLSILNEPLVKPDVSRDDVLRELSLDPREFLSKVRDGRLRRDEAIRLMGLGAGKILVKFIKDLGGVIGIGGNQGTAAASIAMKVLPIGIPKIIVSTVASGNIRPYVEYKDIMIMFSVADLEFGPNTISRLVLTNAVNAMIGMVKGFKGLDIDRSVKRVAVTTLGSTGGLTRQCVNHLKKLGFEPIVFHASGAGGSAMEELIEAGFFTAVLDLNLHELVGEVIPDDIYKPMKSRLVNALRMEIPVIITPGSINYLVFGPPDTIPPKYLGRKTHYHNPYNTNVRLSREELLRVAENLCSKFYNSRRRVRAKIVLPLGGFSVLDMPGGPLYEPDDDVEFINYVVRSLSGLTEVSKVNANINSSEVAYEVLTSFKSILNI